MAVPSRLRARRGLSVGALVVLLLSLALHLAVVRTIAGSTIWSFDEQGKHASTVTVQLRPSPTTEPGPAAARPKPAERPVAKKRQALAPPAAVPVPPLAQEPALASPAPSDAIAPVASANTAAEQSEPDDVRVPGLAADDVPDLPATAAQQKEAFPQRAEPPPPVELRYTVHAIREGAPYHGRGKIRFEREGENYRVLGEASLLFFTVLDFTSSGAVDAQGLAPEIYTEKRFRRSATNTHFHRERGLISFSASSRTYQRQGGEQDRASIVWQLAALGRADPAQLAPGSVLSLFVAGVRDGEAWVLQSVGNEAIEVNGQMQQTIHVIREPRPGSYEQRLDIWLAPALDWYPVKLRFTETSGDFLDMSLSDQPIALRP